MIVFIDPYEERGGGQVVLEGLLACLAPLRADVRLVMPRTGRSKIHVPASIEECDLEDAIEKITAKSVVLVSNANASHIFTLRLARRLRSAGVKCRTVAILHNYPKDGLREYVLRVLLRQFDSAIAVEPGLRRLRGDAVLPPWLSLPPKNGMDGLIDPVARKTLRCFARPDKSKGLHLLPRIFEEVERLGYTCEVALGNSLENDAKYISMLHETLSPWLVPGFRGPDWLLPGDIFIIPSIYGEAACLSAQEAMSRGVFVVASRVGLMPYLSPLNQGIRTFKPGSESSAIAALMNVIGLTAEDFAAECRGAAAQMRQRRGLWYDHVVSGLLKENDSLMDSVRS